MIRNTRQDGYLTHFKDEHVRAMVFQGFALLPPWRVWRLPLKSRPSVSGFAESWEVRSSMIDITYAARGLLPIMGVAKAGGVLTTARVGDLQSRRQASLVPTSIKRWLLLICGCAGDIGKVNWGYVAAKLRRPAVHDNHPIAPR